MRGIQFLTDEAGRKTSVLIDLERNRMVWEDYYDTLLARKRRSQPRESLADVHRKLNQAGKLHG